MCKTSLILGFFIPCIDCMRNGQISIGLRRSKRQTAEVETVAKRVS